MQKNISKHIFLIPSYPKSGNTLLRIIITSLFFSDDGKTNLKKILVDQLEDVHRLLKIKKKNRNDFFNLDNLSTLYKYHLNIKEKKNLNFREDFSFYKTHHSLINYQNYPYITQDFLRGYIYLIRDPRDIVISWSNHSNISIEKSIKFITDSNSCINWPNSKNSTFPMNINPKILLSSWENHVLSWTENRYDVPKLIIKYEDLILKKETIVLKIIDFFNKNYGIEFSNLDEKIKNIIETTDFNFLKKIEKDEGFAERVGGNFFNKGKSNQWKDLLSNDQVKKIENFFYRIMRKYDYS